jgi:hypothetical protein
MSRLTRSSRPPEIETTPVRWRRAWLGADSSGAFDALASGSPTGLPIVPWASHGVGRTGNRASTGDGICQPPVEIPSSVLGMPPIGSPANAPRSPPTQPQAPARQRRAIERQFVLEHRNTTSPQCQKQRFSLVRTRPRRTGTAYACTRG